MFKNFEYPTERRRRVYEFLRRPIIAAWRHALLCAAGRMRAVGRRGRPHGRSVAGELRGKSVGKPPDYPGLKKLQTDGYVFSSDNA